MKKMDTHTISVLVENRFGVLARVAGLFSGRGYNISSLTVNATHDPEISKMTIVTTGDENILEQIDKQLRKLVNVIDVIDLTDEEFVERELLLVKVNAESAEKKSQIIQLVEIFGGKIVTVSKTAIGIELSGRSTRIDNFLNMLEEFGILDTSRSGRVAISRASN
ncbi:MAG: acetolactate synthase small subunit [Victivallaceae bacterium]|nr:acetolactate synthase small subunit [Victivallaceae bacterium]